MNEKEDEFSKAMEHNKEVIKSIQEDFNNFIIEVCEKIIKECD